MNWSLNVFHCRHASQGYIFTQVCCTCVYNHKLQLISTYLLERRGQVHASITKRAVLCYRGVHAYRKSNASGACTWVQVGQQSKQKKSLKVYKRQRLADNGYFYLINELLCTACLLTINLPI